MPPTNNVFVSAQYRIWTKQLSRYSDWLRDGRSRIESLWGRDFRPSRPALGPIPASCTMGTRSFPGVKCGWGVLLTTHPLLCRDHGRVEPHQACNGITFYKTGYLGQHLQIQPYQLYLYMPTCKMEAHRQTSPQPTVGQRWQAEQIQTA